MSETKIRVSLGFTINTGNYNSFRMDVDIEDFPRGDESTNQAYERIKKSVEDKLVVAMKENVAEAKKLING